MNSMYEMIMDLPLFKGVSKDQVSLFLEKTNIGFRNYNIGDTLADIGEPVNMVKFVISGEVALIHPLDGVGITLEERTGFGKVLGADRLFGMATGYPYKAVAKTKASIMEFSKAQYLNLLNSDRIYILNFFNYLSLRAQRPVEATEKYCHGDIQSKMRLLVSVMTEYASDEVVIVAEDEAIADYCNCDEEKVREWKNNLMRAGIAVCDSSSVKIKHRVEFLDKKL